MMTALAMQFFVALPITIVLFFAVEWAFGTQVESGRRIRRCNTVLKPILLPAVLIPLMTLLYGSHGYNGLVPWVLSVFGGVVMVTCVYTLVLLLLLPYLRRHYSAGLIATLWLLPNVLVYTYFIANIAYPLIVIPISVKVFQILMIIWGIGFIGVMGSGLWRHFTFCHAILQNSEAITEPEILDIWDKLEDEMGVTQVISCKFMRSPHIQTPLSIGFFSTTRKVLLPYKEYTSDQMEMILRHEMVHLLRGDTSTKLFLRFCVAMCWFNPFMWKAMRNCTDDLELACDEIALEHQNDAYRYRYAELILDTAGNEKGFSTCLSSKGEGLRYRLNRILHPQNTPVGGRWIVLFSLALAMLYGNICFVGNSVFGAEALFDGYPGLYEEDILPVRTVSIYTPSKDQSWRVKNPDIMKTYLCALELQPVYYVMEPTLPKELKLYYMEEDQLEKELIHNAAEYGRIISISDHFAMVHFWNKSAPTRVYRLKKSIQVEDLYCLLEPVLSN